MTATFWLLGCVLAVAQPPARPAPALRGGDWALTPRLARGQELVYRGTYNEQANSSRVQFLRTYRLETRVFVIDTPPRGCDLAVLTTLKDSTTRAMKPGMRVESVARSVQIERLTLDLQGRLRTRNGGSIVVPIDGAPTLEVGALMEIPSKGKTGQPWKVAETGRPEQVWRVAGQETVNSTPCIKLVGVQQSADWDRPRGDRAAWRRQDRVWVGRKTGLANRVERVIEHKEPARTKATQRSVLRYELESNLRLPSQLAEDRRQEIAVTLQMRDQATPLFAQGKSADRQLVVLLRKLGYHTSSQPPTPYRQALLNLKEQMEAVRRGELVTVGYQETRNDGPVRVGEQAPDFVTTAITFPGSARLAKWQGKPIVLVFYHPGSAMTPEVLRFAQQIHADLGRLVHVVGLSASSDGKRALKQRDELKVGFPLVYGSGMRAGYGVEATPHLVVIDSVGIVRGLYAGWGRETAGEVATELRRWVKK